MGPFIVLFGASAILLWSIFDDLFMNIASFMYRHLVGAYDNMSKWMFRGIEVAV